jgi:hypothetical protein
MNLLQHYYFELLNTILLYKKEYGAFIIISYIFGKVYSSKTTCKIICGWGDFVLLLTSSLLITYVAFQLVYNSQYDQISDYLLIGSIVIFLISIGLSASKNKDIVYVIISILTKIALLLLIPVLTALILLAMGSGKKDGRYRDGTQNNTRTAAVAGAGILMVALIGSLVKTDQDQ